MRSTVVRDILVSFISLWMFLISKSRAQVYLSRCTFDNTETCNFTANSTGQLLLQLQQLQTFSNRTIRPLSDVTSITSATTTGTRAPCQIPYNDGQEDIYFCKRPGASGAGTCITTAGTLETCASGRYASFNANNNITTERKFIWPVHVVGGTIQCLRFWFYMTNAPTVNPSITAQYQFDDSTPTTIITKYIQVPNKWHESMTTFTTPTGTYDITFTLHRETSATAVNSFNFALDEFSILEGPCPAAPTTVTDSSTTTSIVSGTTAGTTEVIGEETTRAQTTVESTVTVPQTTTIVPQTTTTAPQTTTTAPQTTTTVLLTTTSTTPLITTTTRVFTSTVASLDTSTTDTFTSTPIGVVMTTSESPETPLSTDGPWSSSEATTDAITTTTTTPRGPPPIALLDCNFEESDKCFSGSSNPPVVTNGSVFSGQGSLEGPLSDVSSLHIPIINNETCNLPYYINVTSEEGENASTTETEFYFCYKGECVTASMETGRCTLGNYALILLAASINSTAIRERVSSSRLPQSRAVPEPGKQCLRYWYYMSIYNESDWGQRIRVMKNTDGENVTSTEIDSLNRTDVQEKRWYQRNVTFDETETEYELEFVFERDVSEEFNRTIFFALDEVELYNTDCQYVDEYVVEPTEVSPTIPTGVSSTTTSTTSAPTTTASATTTSLGVVTNSTTKPSNNLPLILGLSLGLGIPAVLIVLLGLFYYFKTIPVSSGSSVIPAPTPDIELEPSATKRPRPNATIKAVAV